MRVDVIRPVFKDMGDRDREVLERYYNECHTLAEIAADFSPPVSRQWVHQVKNRAVARAIDMVVGRKCFECRKMYRIAVRAAGRPRLLCPRCGELMDRVPGRDIRKRPRLTSDSWGTRLLHKLTGVANGHSGTTNGINKS